MFMALLAMNFIFGFSESDNSGLQSNVSNDQYPQYKKVKLMSAKNVMYGIAVQEQEKPFWKNSIPKLNSCEFNSNITRGRSIQLKRDDVVVCHHSPAPVRNGLPPHNQLIAQIQITEQYSTAMCHFTMIQSGRW